ncbi:MAG TPA: ATP-binding protein [Candidatus Eisenbacteria bacterium]|nr:ATP-binding protein [Candidatus Eisenbacteria bacterium]
MPGPLRVLIAEDRPADAELMIHELSRAGFEPMWARAETEQQYLSELERHPEVILADHTLPAFNASRALELLRESGLDIPMIVVSGSISEEVAVELVKQGASDYILKDRMARLGPSVKRALDEKNLRAEKRRAEESVMRNLERLKALHEINLAITSTLEIEKLLSALLEKIEILLPFAFATTVRLLNRDSGTLESLACRNLDEREWKAQQTKILRGRARRVVESKSPVIVRDIRTDPRTHNPSIYLAHGLVSYIGLPLMASGEILGVLGVYTRNAHDFSEDEIEFLRAVADQAAIAIHNAQLYDRIQKSNRVKDEFLSVISHELRTPVTVITGYAALMQEGTFGEVAPEMKPALDAVVCRASDLLGLVDSILEATMLETGSASVNPEAVDLLEFVQSLQATLRSPASGEIRVRWHFAPNLPVITTDRTKLRYILQGLINNAVKFTEKGAITISAEYLEGSGEVRFSVLDTGIGIPAAFIERIFDKFAQVDSSSSRPREGAGLGLYLVKKLTELLGGTIEVRSELGNGSCFTVTVPAQCPPPTAYGCNRPEKRSPVARAG